MSPPYESGHSPFFPFPASRSRVDLFRGRHRIGERISGIFARWEGKGLGWVDFPTGSMLASMASQPRPGARLQFLIKQMYPDIVLQEILPKAQPGLFNLLQEFWAAQGRVESLFRQVIAENADHSLRELETVFEQALDRNPRLHAEHERMATRLSAINAELDRKGCGRFACLPWLSGRVREAGVLLSRDGSFAPDGSFFPAEAQFVCAHSRYGQMEIHFALACTKAGFRLYLEHGGFAAQFEPWLVSWVARFRSGLPCLGVKPLPDGLRTGVLARLLLPWEPGTAGLHVQV